ncbi:unnamed protein product [Closterium sp. Naga37s-1]|nr:unnamed protein product [Closterium sp. Naga37s-1]CAI5534003.1 unnamed protein product [Closterium sp. Naga37s-1]
MRTIFRVSLFASAHASQSPLVSPSQTCLPPPPLPPPSHNPQLPMVSPFTGNRTMRAIFRFSANSFRCCPHVSLPHPLCLALPMVSPFTGNRTMRAIFRFSAKQNHRAPLVHQGHDLRPELLKMYGRKRIKGWSFALTHASCVSPPLLPHTHTRADVWAEPHQGVELHSEGGEADEQGVAAGCLLHLPARPLPVDQPPLQGRSGWVWVIQVNEALISGCIPVTFFRDHDNPWDDELDYSSFSINIDPDDIASLRSRLDTAPVEQLQRGVERVQRMHIQGAV